MLSNFLFSTYSWLLALMLTASGAWAAECGNGRLNPAEGIVHAHRGYGDGPGENTLWAFRQAMAAGADALELDLQVTKDQQLVLSHDAAVAEHCRLKGRAGKNFPEIAKVTLEELKKFDCGPLDESKRQGSTADFEIPALRELFDLAQADKRVRFNIEMKEDSPALPAVFARLLVTELRKAGLLDRAIIQSFTIAHLDAVNKELKSSPAERSKLQLSALVGLKYFGSDLAKLAKAHDLQIISPNVNRLPLSRAKVDALHRSNVKILPYTSDDPAQWEKIIPMGIDGIITNKPKELIDFLKARPEYRCLTNAPDPLP